jgi:hypothetical protein
MTITREIDGKKTEIELTLEELRLAGNENDLIHHAEDVLAKMKELAGKRKIPLTIEHINKIPEDALKKFALTIADIVENELEDNENYWESFWITVELVLKDSINWDEELAVLLDSVTQEQSDG